MLFNLRKKIVFSFKLLLISCIFFVSGCAVTKKVAHPLAKKEYITFKKTFGGKKAEDGLSVQQTSDGGYIISGYTTSSGMGNADAYIIKLDEYGNVLWQKTFGGRNWEAAFCVHETKDGGYAFVGHTFSFGEGRTDVYFVKIDKDGNVLWQKTFGGKNWDFGRCVKETADGGYMILGDSNSFSNNGSDIYLIKTDAYGEKLWSKVYGGKRANFGSSIVKTADGDFVILGHMNMPGNIGSDMHLLKVDKDGNELWSRTFGGDGTQIGRSIYHTTDGGYILFGRSDSQHKSFCDLYLVKTDESGEILWEKRYRKYAWNFGRTVLQTTDGGYAMLACTYTPGKADEMYLLKTDENGETIWGKTYGGGKSDSGVSLRQTTDGGYVMIGYIFKPGTGADDIYIIKTDPDGNVYE